LHASSNDPEFSEIVMKYRSAQTVYIGNMQKQ